MSGDGIRLRGLTKRYGATIALAGVDLDLRPGEVLGIAGPNGAAALLGMKRSTLQSRIQKLGIRISRSGA